jgi:hypothetical protein
MLDFTTYIQPTGKFRRVGEGHLDKDHIVWIGQVIVPGDLAQLVAVLGPVPAVRFIRNEPDRPPRNVSEEELRGLVEGDVGNPQLERAGKPGR